MIVFSNTTPFISLSSISLLHLLPSLFGEVIVAHSVADECKEGGRIFVPALENAANAMRGQGIYFHVELVKRISARLGEAF